MSLECQKDVFKLFIGGLTVETSEMHLENHFSKFGFIFDVIIIRNRATGGSKGYGFISCNCYKTYQRIINTDHIINDRAIDCHASFKKLDDPEKFQENANKKIFVGGISSETSDKDLFNYFSRFGNVRQAYVIKDPVSKRSKKFGFAIMKDQESVDSVLAVSCHSIKGLAISCKLFVRFDEDTEKKENHEAINHPNKEIVGKPQISVQEFKKKRSKKPKTSPIQELNHKVEEKNSKFYLKSPLETRYSLNNHSKPFQALQTSTGMVVLRLQSRLQLCVRDIKWELSHLAESIQSDSENCRINICI